MPAVRTRIAPSPTGEDLHIGNLQAALVNYAVAKKNGGQFIVRIEDTDQVRKVEGSEAKILQTLKDYGINYDEGPDKTGASGPYRQSERLDTYRIYAKELIDKSVAYYCICSKDRLTKLREKQQKEKQIPRYDKHCLRNQEEVVKKVQAGETHVIRLNVPPNTEIKFNDVIRGEISFNTDNLDDQVLMKSDGFPTYHLAVVVDDNFMKITHVIRGEDWIPSTPKHIILYEAFGWDKPVFAHIPLLRNPDKSKLSKRKNPVWAGHYLKQGYLPEAMLNYLALMGWTHPQQKDVFSLEEFIKLYDFKNVQTTGPIFDIVKLEWMSGEYIRMMDDKELTTRIHDFYSGKLDEKIITQTIPLVKERIKKLSDYKSLTEFFFKRPEEYQIDIKPHKKLIEKMSNTLRVLRDWKAEEIGRVMQELALAENIKNSDFFMTLRVVITGKKVSPPLNESMELLGKKEVLERLS